MIKKHAHYHQGMRVAPAAAAMLIVSVGLAGCAGTVYDSATGILETRLVMKSNTPFLRNPMIVRVEDMKQTEKFFTPVKERFLSANLDLLLKDKNSGTIRPLGITVKIDVSYDGKTHSGGAWIPLVLPKDDANWSKGIYQAVHPNQFQLTLECMSGRCRATPTDLDISTNGLVNVSITTEVDQAQIKAVKDAKKSRAAAARKARQEKAHEDEEREEAIATEAAVTRHLRNRFLIVVITAADPSTGNPVGVETCGNPHPVTGACNCPAGKSRVFDSYGWHTAGVYDQRYRYFRCE